MKQIIDYVLKVSELEFNEVCQVLYAMVTQKKK